MEKSPDIKAQKTQTSGVSKLIISATFLLLLASVFGLWLNFIPTKSYSLFCKIFSFAISGPLFIYLFFYYKKYKAIELKTKVCYALLSSIVYFVIINIFVTYTAPYIFLSSDNIKSMHHKVAGVVDGPWIETHGCQHYVTFDFGNGYRGNKVCVSADQIKQYSVGQKLLVTANHSSLGMRIIKLKTF